MSKKELLVVRERQLTGRGDFVVVVKEDQGLSSLREPGEGQVSGRLGELVEGVDSILQLG